MIEIHWIECFKKTKILFVEHRFIYFWLLFRGTKGKLGSVRKHVLLSQWKFTLWRSMFLEIMKRIHKFVNLKNAGIRDSAQLFTS